MFFYSRKKKTSIKPSSVPPDITHLISPSSYLPTSIFSFCSNSLFRVIHLLLIFVRHTTWQQLYVLWFMCNKSFVISWSKSLGFVRLYVQGDICCWPNFQQNIFLIHIFLQMSANLLFLVPKYFVVLVIYFTSYLFLILTIDRNVLLMALSSAAWGNYIWYLIKVSQIS